MYNDQIISKNHIGIGLIKFGSLEAKDWQDKITMRFGVYRKNYNLSMGSKEVIENGLSFGFGFKFAGTGNQIDFSFRNGNRFIDKNNKENFKEFNVGISIGDVWFLRRRTKQ